MAKTFQEIPNNVETGLTIQAGHVSQSIDAFTGVEAYDITLSGSLTVTGSIKTNGLEDAGGSSVSLLAINSTGEVVTTGSSALYSTDKLIATTRIDDVFGAAGSNPFSFNAIDNSEPSGSFQFGNTSTFAFETRTLENDTIVIGSTGVYQLGLSSRLKIPGQNTEVQYTLNVYDALGGTLLNTITIDRNKSDVTTSGTFAVDSFFGTYPLLDGYAIEIIFTLVSNSAGTTLGARSEIQIEKLS